MPSSHALSSYTARSFFRAVDIFGQSSPKEGSILWFIVFFLSVTAMFYFNLFGEAEDAVWYALEVSVLASGVIVAFCYGIVCFLRDAVRGWSTNKTVRIICLCVKCISAYQINYLATLYMEETVREAHTAFKYFGLASIDCSISCLVSVILAENVWHLLGLLTTTFNLLVVYFVGQHYWKMSNYASISHNALMCGMIVALVLKQRRNIVVHRAAANPCLSENREISYLLELCNRMEVQFCLLIVAELWCLYLCIPRGG